MTKNAKRAIIVADPVKPPVDYARVAVLRDSAPAPVTTKVTSVEANPMTTSVANPSRFMDMNVAAARGLAVALENIALGDPISVLHDALRAAFGAGLANSLLHVPLRAWAKGGQPVAELEKVLADPKHAKGGRSE